MHLLRALAPTMLFVPALTATVVKLPVRQSWSAWDASTNASARCTAVASAVANSTVDVLIADIVAANTNVSVVTGQEVCVGYSVATPGTSYAVTVDICRIVANISTTAQSFVSAEYWLPIGQGEAGTTDAAWNGRLIATGNPQLSGCLLYTDLQYLTSLGFAAIGDNGGHDGYNSTQSFENRDVLLDWNWRARYASTKLGQQIVSAFYNNDTFYRYYFGCSTAGRQGLKIVQDHPQLFHGVIAGAAANDANHQLDAGSNFYLITGNTTDPRFVTLAQWTVVALEVLTQCDLIDGVQDGVVEDPTLCQFDPSTLVCGTGNSSHINDTTCLSPLQSHTVAQIYKPVRLWGNGTLLFPGLTPSSEVNAYSFVLTGSTGANPLEGWFRYAVLNNASFDIKTISNETWIAADRRDAYNGYVSSYNGNLSAFRDLGGKLITYQGLSDGGIAGTNSMRYYEHVASTMNATPAELDEWYRYFRISGMGHCRSGDGAWAIGQNTASENSTGNVIWDIVNWVEQGEAPDVLVGTKWVNDVSSDGILFERPHCRYPYRTTYIGGNPNVTSSWGCTFIADWKAAFPEEDF